MNIDLSLSLSLSLYIYMYIYTYLSKLTSCESPDRLASVEYFFLGPTKASILNLARYSTISERPGNSCKGFVVRVKS